MEFDLNFTVVCLFRIFLSFIAGFTLGLERKSRAQAFGLRTLILICESSTLLAILSLYIPKLMGVGDGGRVMAQVVSGIGFLGGGAIVRQGLNIKGLTSAAIIWAAASIGLAIGSGLYIPAGVALLVAVFSLIILEKFEEKHFPAGRAKTLHLGFATDSINMSELKKTIENNGFIITDFNESRIFSQNQVILHYSVKAPRRDDFSDLINDLQKIGKLTEFSITD
ncbi:MAG: MgtC/SapB family protein [Treponema sp.]|nr:MgtC/SapB family protein [Candidatus Treponema equifaecale]